MHFQIEPDSRTPLYRQIVDAVEAGVASGELAPGARLPTIRQLAAEMAIHANTVAHAYAELEQMGVVTTRPGAGTFVAQSQQGGRLAAERESRLQGIVGRALLEALGLGHSADEVEAAVALRLARWRETARGAATTAIAPLPGDTIVVVGSHDLILDVLAGQLRQGTPSLTMTTTNVGSLAGLMALLQGEAHVAGCHLLDWETGEYNLPYIKRLLPSQDVVVVNLAHRLQGLMVRRGNSKAIQRIEDLARADVAFVNRQKGSGTRVLLDYELRQAGIASERVKGYDREEITHLAVATAVASGSADVGLGIFAAARALELDFVPLLKERYDLVIPRSYYEGELLRPLLEVLHDPAFHRLVEALGGYDAAQTGQVMN